MYSPLLIPPIPIHSPSRKIKKKIYGKTDERHVLDLTSLLFVGTLLAKRHQREKRGYVRAMAPRLCPECVCNIRAKVVSLLCSCFSFSISHFERP